jgi:8-oxo-dGTP pyrophosphatase MutT (NUDIX family)
MQQVVYVPKSCTYVTRDGANGRELLVFDDGRDERFQVPKGTVERDESPRAAARRELAEESGLRDLPEFEFVASDVWTRRDRPSVRKYIRHFFHVHINEPREEWHHTVSEGHEWGREFRYSWVELSAPGEFALELDTYLDRVR